MNWTSKTVAVWQDWHFGPYRCFKKSFDGPWHLSKDGAVIFTAEGLQDVMTHAEASLT